MKSGYYNRKPKKGVLEMERGSKRAFLLGGITAFALMYINKESSKVGVLINIPNFPVKNGFDCWLSICDL